MCKDCIITPEPERGTFCANNGCYLLNYKGCAGCSQRIMPKVVDEEKHEDEEEESVSFKHVCSACSHIICEHTWNFRIDGEYQEYEMSCLLCGCGESSHSIAPHDPKKINQYSNY